jgi:exosortase
MKPLIVGLGPKRPPLPASSPGTAKMPVARPQAVAGDVSPADPVVPVVGGDQEARVVGVGASVASETSPAGAVAPATIGASMPQFSSQQRVAAVNDEEEFLPQLKRKWSEFLIDMRDPFQRTTMITVGLFTALLVYSYLPGLTNAYIAWANPQYAHGWIVPLFSAALLFWWRQPIAAPVTLSARLAGLFLLAAGLGLRLFAASYQIVTIDMYTFVPAICGVFILLGGWSMFSWAWAPLMFLIFMYPLPDEATRYLLGPLQTTATMVSTFALQTLGLEAYREGNQIVIGEMHLGVVDACSGLRMLTIFCALAVGLVMVGRRSWWENGIILASAIPIALTVNSIRITVTGLLFQVADTEFAERVFHDWAGLVMMPMAMAMLWAEQYILSNVFLAEIDGPAVLGHSGAATPESAGRMAKAAAAPAVLGLGPIAAKGNGAAAGKVKGNAGPVVGFPPRKA